MGWCRTDKEKQCDHLEYNTSRNQAGQRFKFYMCRNKECFSHPEILGKEVAKCAPGTILRVIEMPEWCIHFIGERSEPSTYESGVLRQKMREKYW